MNFFTIFVWCALSGRTSRHAMIPSRHILRCAVTAIAASIALAATASRRAEPTHAVDSAVMSIMRRYDLPAASVAVVRDDRIVYTAAYGVKDTITRKAAATGDRYRIASLSKPVTMAGILLLAAQGRLSLDDTVFGRDGILGLDYGPVPAGSGKERISVRHLLEHTSGWENLPDDPMFANAGASQRQIIARMLAARPLAAPAGERYSYSNFGYLILGRVIEKVSGIPYERFIRRHLLRHCRIRRMRIGEAHGQHPRRDEPQYCLQPHEIDGTYYLDIERMDAHGGWTATAEDVARLMIRIDRNPAVPDIIPDSLASQFYLGFERWIHTGSLPGTAAVMMRIDERLSFVLLANRRSDDARFWDDLAQIPAEAIIRHYGSARH